MIGWLDRGWRLFATGLSFLVFGIGGLAMALVAFPLVNLVVRNAGGRQRFAQRLIRNTWKIYLRFMSGLGVLTLEVRGGEHLLSDRGTIVIANHPTLLDIVILMSLLGRAQCVVKEGVWRNPFMRSAVRAANFVPNLSDADALLAACQDALSAGNNLIIFPEGTRTVPGRERKYHRGFAHLALRTGAPLRLVALACDPPTLLKGDRWYDIPSRRPHFRVQVLEKVHLPDMGLDTATPLAVTCSPSFPPTWIRAGRFFCASAWLKQWAA